MPSIGQTTRPGYVYDSATDTWIPIGIGPHTHASTDLSGVIANSIVDAKADLITATADNTPARLAVGANGTVLTANSATATGLEWAAVPTPTLSFKGCAVNWTSFNIPNNTETTIIWYNEDFDTDGFHSTSSNESRITIPTGLGGKYLIQTKGSMPTAGSAYAATVRIKKNGNDFKANNFVVPTTGEVSFVMSEVHSLSAGDYLTITVLQSSGGTRTLNLGEFGYFGVTYLGA